MWRVTTKLLAGVARWRDLLTERRAAQRANRGQSADPAPIIDNTVDMRTNYYVIIHCAHCGAPIQAKLQGSKGPVKRVCDVCRQRLRLKAA